MITIETPSITGGTTAAQLQQLQSYLYRMARQLQWAFDTLEAGPGASGESSPALPAGKPAARPPEQIFGDIKHLIIKSADIVSAYSQEIGKKLQGTYVARSEFGTYREQTSQELQGDSQQIRQLFESHETLQRAMEDLSEQNFSANAWIHTGLIGRDEQNQPIYGLEIGQRNQVDGKPVFERFARFRPNRLSFFDSANVEVAYISDYRLCITNAEIAGTLRIGGKFRIYSGGGLIFQWTGGKDHE